MKSLKSAFLAIVAALFAPSMVKAAEPQLFDVVMTTLGDNKIQAIRVVRLIHWMGLAEAKTLVESTPKTLQEGYTKEEGESAIQKLAAVNCKAELRPSQVTKMERYELVLKRFDPSRKVQVAAMMEGATGCSEDDAIKHTENLPTVVKKGMTAPEAKGMKLSFDDINAESEVKESK
jgi:large subunit ribosomal protein L7/L12